jgi:8-oxo-dGTP pyrophosphatase MutT (NUDIX family)
MRPGWRYRLANTVRTYPWIMVTLQRLYRLTRPRYTVGVKAVLFNARGQVLLVEHVLHPHHPWGLPGGWVDRGERPRDSMARELQEELGLAVRVGPVVHVEELGGMPHLDLTYLCETQQSVGRLSGELLGYAWYDVDALPDVFSTQREAILAARKLVMSDER